MGLDIRSCDIPQSLKDNSEIVSEYTTLPCPPVTSIFNLITERDFKLRLPQFKTATICVVTVKVRHMPPRYSGRGLNLCNTKQCQTPEVCHPIELKFEPFDQEPSERLEAQ